MKRTNRPRHQRLKLILAAVGMVVVGALLVVLSMKIKPPEGPATSQPTATTTVPASAPAQRQPSEPVDTVTGTMSQMVLLFGLVAFVVSGVCVVLVILDIRRCRPAWQTQTRYPRRR